MSSGYKLIFAITNNDESEVQKLLASGADPNYQDDQGNTPLMHAAKIGNSVIADLLISKGANPDFTTIDGQFPLYIAMVNDKPDVFELLLRRGANPNHYFRGDTLLIIAARNGQLDYVKDLIGYGADPELINIRRETALDVAREADVVEYLRQIRGGATATARGVTNLMRAAQEGRVHLIEEYLKQTADIDQKDPNGNTALMLAVAHGHPKIIDDLLAAGANPNVANDKKETPLFWAIVKDEPRMAKLLVEAGADLALLDPETKEIYSEIVERIEKIPAIDIETTCVNETDPFTTEPLIPRGTISITWERGKTSYCYDLRQLRTYLNSQGIGTTGYLFPGDVQVYHLPPGYYITEVSKDTLLKSDARFYRADQAGKARISREDQPYYQLRPV